MQAFIDLEMIHTNYKTSLLFQAKLDSSVGSAADFGTGGLLFRSPAWPIFFPKIDDSHWDRIHSSLTAVCCFNNGNVGKQPVAWKDHSLEYRLKELQESMDRCSG